MDTQKTKIVSRNKALIALTAATSCLVIYILACVWSPVTWSPDSSKIAILVTSPTDAPSFSNHIDRFAIFTYDISTGERVLLDEIKLDKVKKDGVLSAPSWSPDGKWIAYYRVEPSPPVKPAVDLQSDSNTTPTLESVEKSPPEVSTDKAQETGKADINSVGMFSEESKMLPSFLLDAFTESLRNEKKEVNTFDVVKLMVVSPNGKERKVLAGLQFCGEKSEQSESMCIMQPQWSKDSKYLFYARVLDIDDLYYISSLNIDTGEACAHLFSSYGSFSLSPDGKWIASLLKNQSNEFLLNVTGVDGTIQKYFKLDLEIVEEQLALGLKVSWSRDSKDILIPAKEGFEIIDSETGEMQKYSDPNTEKVACRTFSPNSRNVYYVAGYETGEPNSKVEKIALNTFALDSKKTKTITFLPKLAGAAQLSISPNGKMVLLRGVVADLSKEVKSALIFWNGKTQKIIETDRWLQKPFYTDADIIFEEKLIGKWKGENGEIWEFKKMAEKVYKIKITAIEKDSENYLFAANLVKLKDTMFLAIFNDEFVLQGNNSYDRFLPDAFVKIDQMEPKLLLQKMKYEDDFELFNKDPNSLKQGAKKANYYDFEGIRVQQKNSNTPDARK
ncbi:MAG: hypothetical protein MUP16_00305 [Sedimentisphaerales bacterium]|nr:hypothetical protein [Sedimentisphaerales bacterium]